MRYRFRIDPEAKVTVLAPVFRYYIMSSFDQ